MEIINRSSENTAEKIPARQFDVLTPKQFLNDLKNEVNYSIINVPFDATKSHKLYVQAMSVRFFGESTKEMFNILRKATENGLDVRLNIDSYRDTVLKEINRTKNILGKKDKLNIEEMIISGRNDYLDKHGAEIRIVNPIKNIQSKLIFIRGRNHIKIASVDDTAWIGSMNFSEDQFEIENFVVKITDPRIVMAIQKQFLQVNENRPKIDYEVKCTENATLLVDSGRQRKSIILDQATEAVNKAQEQILFLSQFMPEGKFLKALHDAHKRGVKLVCLQSDTKEEDFLGRSLNTFNRLKAKQHSIPVNTVPNKRIHSKLLITDTTAFFGSHNFSDTGVNNKTEEMDIKTTEPVLVKNLVEYFQKLQNLK
jgi:phosphatidylserine/phosphatidylglycerophosphate/cardiolipin synthase-like enzyme